MPMTTTGPLPAVREEVFSGQRMAVLEHMGALCSDGISYRYATADAVADPCRGVLYIAVDQDPDPGDWDQVCRLIAAVGWDNGSQGPHSGDPGEPELDPLGRVCTWKLEYGSRCIWCDGRGTRNGCPLCQRVSLGVSLTASPGSPLILSLGAGAFCCPCLVAAMMRT